MSGTQQDSGLIIQPLGAGKDLRRAGREDSHPIPEFDIPDGWQRNEPMCSEERTQIGLRNDDFDRFIEIYSVEPLATVKGPYWVEVHKQVGGPDSFQTRQLGELFGVEPGQMQEAVEDAAEVADGE